MVCNGATSAKTHFKLHKLLLYSIQCEKKRNDISFVDGIYLDSPPAAFPPSPTMVTLFLPPFSSYKFVATLALLHLIM